MGCSGNNGKKVKRTIIIKWTLLYRLWETFGGNRCDIYTEGTLTVQAHGSFIAQLSRTTLVAVRADNLVDPADEGRDFGVHSRNSIASASEAYIDRRDRRDSFYS